MSTPPVTAPDPAEVDVPALEVRGELPVELDGAYVRHAPGPRSVPAGNGALHRVVVRDGGAGYSTRPGRPTGTVSTASEVTVVRPAGRLLTFADPGVTARPKVDPRTGEIVVSRCHLDPPYLTWWVIRPDGSVTAPLPIAGLGRPVLVYDTALTEHYVVLVVAPLFLDPPLSWEPEHGTRIAVVPRDGGPVRWCHDEAFWVRHGAGAHERDDPAAGNPVVLDHVEWPRPADLVPGPAGARGLLTRVVLDPAAGTVTRTVLDPRSVELPRIDDRRVTSRPGTIAVTCASGRRHTTVPDALSWIDPDAGTAATWPADELVPGEPAYAPCPGTAASDRGWWLSLAMAPGTGESWLLVFPAADPGAGPQARVRLPVRVPPGRHGTWLPARPTGDRP
ncbi:carotenoid oxygenase family protein [Actinomycetospora chlora]